MNKGNYETIYDITIQTREITSGKGYRRTKKRNDGHWCISK